MNAEDRSVVERHVADWLNASAPEPPAGMSSRLLEATRTVPQRGNAGLSWFAGRAAGLAAVVLAAVAIGLGLSQVMRSPSVGETPAPISSPTQAPTAPTEPSPSGAPVTPAPTTGARPGRIAFQANRANETSGIYLMEADGSNVVQLVDDPEIHEMDPIWSPDGSLIAYRTMTADGSLSGGVFLADPDGGEPVQVDDAYAYSVPVWSPDGSLLALAGNGEEPTGIGLYSIADGSLEPLTTDGGTAPLWSPDGTRIAYNVAPPNDIRVVDVATGDVRNLTDDPWNDTVGRWTSDGTQIVFASDRDTDQSRDSQRSWIVSADGGSAELLGEPVLAFAHWPSPDGAWLAYGAADGLHLSAADGSDDRLIYPAIPADQGPSWAADSSAFVFSDVTEAPREILVMRVDAEAPEAMTDDPADDSAPNWGLAVDR
jgi:Tol biopolymer transport system component